MCSTSILYHVYVLLLGMCDSFPDMFGMSESFLGSLACFGVVGYYPGRCMPEEKLEQDLLT